MINLSKYSFSVYKYKLLGYNFNFIPTPEKSDQNQFKNDIANFARKLKLKAHFGNTQTLDTNNENIKFKPPTNKTWIPPKVHHTIETFIESFQKQIDQNPAEATPKKTHNLSTEERIALQQLKKKNDIIIIKADKGGALTILNLEDYIADAYKQLNDIQCYTKLTYDQTYQHAKTINDTIDMFKANHKLTEKIADGLKSHNPKTPTLRLPPKVHKENHPGRPIVSSINSHSTKISEYVDHHLQPYTKDIKSYIKDTKDFLNHLDKVPTNIFNNSYLVTLDVRSLYTSIPNEEGISIVKDILHENKSKLTQVITAFLWLILTLNNFIFNNEHFLQILGVVMGTKCAPIYANLFMNHFEETYIYPLLTTKCNFYKRYIDDIFLLWQGTLEELKLFILQINRLHPTIKFTEEISFNSINFLDCHIYKSKDGKLHSSVHTKATDRKSYLHSKSYHPRSSKRSIAYSQALRIRRICSEETEYIKEINKLIKQLEKRGYDTTSSKLEIEKAHNIPRETLLTNNKVIKDRKLPIIVTYNKNLPNITKAIDDNWHILSINHTISEYFSEKPRITYRRNQNLGNILGRHTLKNNKIVSKFKPTQGKCQPCLSRRNNLCCKQMATTTNFTNRKTGRQFQIYHTVNCKSVHVIYLIECILCLFKPYVGKCETSFNLRLNNHRTHAKCDNSILIDKHFKSVGHDFTQHARVTIIEKLEKTNIPKELITKTLERREDFWMAKLDTLKPFGFNISLNNPSK